MTESKTSQLGFLIFDGFPMACLTSVIEPLRAANEIVGHAAFGWTLFGELGDRVLSSAQVAFETSGVLDAQIRVDHLFLLSSPTETFATPTQTSAVLRSLSRHGVPMVAISGGVFPVLRAGLVQHDPVSVHWCYEAAFRAEFPDAQVSGDVIVAGPRVSSVSGAAAAFDFALHVIEEKLGRDIAHEVACWFQHPLVRGEGVRQTVPIAQAPDTGDRLPDLVAQAIALWAQDLSVSVPISAVAQHTGVTPRQVERAFKAATGQSPSHYYRGMRMKAARQLVMYSKDPVADIAAAVGYASATPLITHYRNAYGVTPSEDRRRVNQFRVSGNAPVPSV